jgi:hypothetical protein
MLCNSCRKAEKTLQLFPYKVYAIQQLLPLENEKYHYCAWLLVEVQDDRRILDFILVPGEAWFHLTNYVNSQNNRAVSRENPHAAHGTAVHPVKIGML